MLMFLDIDGVMVPAQSWKIPEFLNDGFPKFSEKAVNVLQGVITDDTTVMLTTSHKSTYTIEAWKTIFEKRGLSVNNLKSLEANTDSLNRKDEILNWFNFNGTSEEFVIIDDDTSLNDLPAFFKKNLILTSSYIGLTDTHLDQINSIRNGSFGLVVYGE